MMGALKITSLNIRTWPHQREERIGEASFGVGAVVREI